jgi:hypothetical protein
MATKTRKYFKTDTEKVRRRAETLGAGKYFKPKVGKNVVRILPPWSEEGLFYFETALHYGFQSDGRERAYPCLKLLGKKACPMCAFSDDLLSGSTEDQELGKRVQARRKFYATVIDRNNPGSAQIWGFSAKVLKVLSGYMDDPDWGDFTDPEEGHDIVIERTGSGRNDTRYEIRIKPRSTAIDVDGWEEMMIDLPKVVIEETSADQMQDIIDENYGEGAKSKKIRKADDDEDEDDEEDEEEEKPKSSKSKTTGDDKDEEEEEKAPKAKRSRSSDDDDEEEDDEEEEEEDERPRRKKR